MESSAPCSSSRTRTSGFPCPMRVRVRAISSKTAVLSSAFAASRRTRVRRGGPQLADLAEHREEREEVSREIGEVGPRRGARARVLGPEVVLDQLAEALMRECAILLHEAALEDADLPGAREARELLDEPGLPDPRLARHDGELAFPGDGRVQPSLQLGYLLLAPDERRRRRLRPGHHPAGRQHHRARVLVLVELAAVAPQCLGQVPGPLRPLLGILLQALKEDRLQLLAHVGAEGPHRLRQLVDDPVEDGLHLARKGRLPGEAFIEDRPERVEVGPPVEAPRRHLLGAEVGDRPDERPRLREAVLGGRERQAEVHHPGADVARVVARRHDVLGLDVAVDDAAGVAVVERLGDLRPDVEDVAEAQRAFAQERPQVRAGQDRHDEEESPFIPAEVVDRDDAGVVHLGDDLGLALEALLGVLREVPGRDELDGHLAVQDGILRSVDDAHPAAPQLGEDLVAVGELCPDHRHRLIHRFS